MTTDMQQAPYMGYGRARKVTSIKTSDEVHQTRIREKKEQKLAKQRALIQAVEQAVALPEILPHREEITVEQITPDPCPQPTHDDTHDTEMPTTASIGKRVEKWGEHIVGQVTSFIDRMRTFVLEEG